MRNKAHIYRQLRALAYLLVFVWMTPVFELVSHAFYLRWETQYDQLHPIIYFHTGPIEAALPGIKHFERTYWAHYDVNAYDGSFRRLKGYVWLEQGAVDNLKSHHEWRQTGGESIGQPSWGHEDGLSDPDHWFWCSEEEELIGDGYYGSIYLNDRSRLLYFSLGKPMRTD